jgi:hypothetical protein
MKKFLPLIILIVFVAGVSAILVVTQIKKAASTVTPGTIPAPSASVDDNGFKVSGGQGTPGSTNTNGSVLSQIALKITSPVNGAVVGTSELTVRGVTLAKADVFVNEAETTADAAGNFTAKVSLDEGENYILVTVNDADGNAAEQEFTVTYQPTE